MLWQIADHQDGHTQNAQHPLPVIETFLCVRAEILSVPLTQTRTRNIQQTLIYDNLVHLIIATEHTEAGRGWTGRALSAKPTHAGTYQPSCVNELAILFCSVLVCVWNIFIFIFHSNSMLIYLQDKPHFDGPEAVAGASCGSLWHHLSWDPRTGIVSQRVWTRRGA